VRDDEADGDPQTDGQSEDPRSPTDGTETDTGEANVDADADANADENTTGVESSTDATSERGADEPLKRGESRSAGTPGAEGDPDRAQSPDPTPDAIGGVDVAAGPDAGPEHDPRSEHEAGGEGRPGADVAASGGGDGTSAVDPDPDADLDLDLGLDPDVDVEEAIGTVRTRRDILVALTDGPVDKAALTASVSVSRSTVNRAIRRLDELGFVERVAGGWRISLAGRFALRAFARFRERMAGIVRGRPLLEHVPVDPGSTPTLAPPPVLFADGVVAVIGEDLTVAEAGRRVATFLEGADRWSGLVKRINPAILETSHTRIVDGDTGAAVVLDPAAVETLLGEWRDQLAAMVATGRLTLHVAENLPFGLYVAEAGEATRACLVAYDDLDRPRGFAVSAAPAAVAWAREVVADRLEAADRVDPTG
jgi:predicted transcriptional regulator